MAGAGFWRWFAADGRDPGEIEPDELERRLRRGDAPMIIDVRQPEEYAQGHIPGARLIPLDQLPQRVGELDPGAEIVAVCRSGNRSGVAAEWLRAQGFRRVLNLRGGLKAWRGPLAYGTGERGQA
jgi:rhodanese-related sulfurtransferase